MDSGIAGGSIVNPNPTRLEMNTKADIPAHLNRFFAGFFRMRLNRANIRKIGAPNKLMMVNKRNKIFMTFHPFTFVFFFYISSNTPIDGSK